MRDLILVITIILIQEIDDPDQLKAVSGALGLVGVVTAVTLKMDKMTYARFHPKKTLMADSIPKPGTDTSHPAFKRMVELCRLTFKSLYTIAFKI